ncbi:MAG: autotransporter domain-containing protein [Desulfovibrio sp.]|uniref:beta strand repeat-containing protein n=1 Tax=Desulfovibrio sp. TaxID=885 RepID=UPI0039E3C8B2
MPRSLVFFLICCFGIPLSSFNVSNAETVTYDGTDPALQVSPIGGATSPSLIPGAASGNDVTVDYNAGTAPHRVFGGLSDTEKVTRNTVNFFNGTVNNNLYGGYDAAVTSGFGAHNNAVNISGGVVAGHAVAGQSLQGDVTNNAATLSGGSVTKNLYGGSSNGAGIASGNTVTISRGTVGDGLGSDTNGWIIGGRSTNGQSFGNAILFSGGTANYATAGESNSNAAFDNRLSMTGGLVVGSAKGGWSNTGDVSYNHVSISGGRVGDGLGTITNGWVIGGATTDGSAANNTVTISGSAVVNCIDVAESTSGSVYGNKLIITGGDIKGAVARAGWSDTGLVFGNEVYMSGGVIHDNTTNSSLGYLSGGLSRFGNAERNTVTIIGGSVNSVTGGDAPGGNVTGNSVTVSGDTQIKYVRGGFAGGSATNNRDLLSGDSQIELLITGGQAGNGDARDNVVIINGGITGATGSIFGGTSVNGAATGNSVIISSGMVNTYSIFGGHSDTGAATNNSITINSGATFGPATTLYGGQSGSGGQISGNTLNINAFRGSFAGVHNFENYNFILPASVGNGGTVLTVSGLMPTDLAGTKVAITELEQGSVLAPGSTISLISSTQNTPKNVSATNVRQGISFYYDFSIDATSGQLIAKVNSVSVNQQLKALSEGFVSGLGLVTQGADVAAGQGMASAVSAAKSGAAGGGMPIAGFGALSGGSVRYNSGSHVDMHSLSLLAGLALGTDITPGRLTFGAFFEYGNGSYNTYNSFSNAASVDGNGNTHYLGGGILGRMNFINTGPGHFYTEASGRAGNVYNNYESSDLRDANGREASYDSTSAYYGLHLGTGYIWNITDEASLDLYGKYFWTRQTGDSITLSTGDPIDFDDVYSSRLRFGSRFAYAVNEYVSPYVGAAWEHEFDGKARASTNGYDMKAPSLRGDTGIGELGLTFTPSQTLPLSFDLGVQGYAGKREGVTGSLQAKYEF